MGRPATADDFTRWEAKAKELPIASLLWSERDALKASQNLDGHDPARAGYYRDEALTYRSEINRRRA
jgi:hypothetical protein